MTDISPTDAFRLLQTILRKRMTQVILLLLFCLAFRASVLKMPCDDNCAGRVLMITGWKFGGSLPVPSGSIYIKTEGSAVAIAKIALKERYGRFTVWWNGPYTGHQVDGRWVVRDGVCVTVDLVSLQAEQDQRAPALFARAGVTPVHRWPHLDARLWVSTSRRGRDWP